MTLEKFLSDTPIEGYMTERMSKNPNMMVPYYLMAAFAYYKQDDPIVTDSFYDQLAKDLLEVYDSIEHRHKSVISKDALKSGTFIGKYPTIVEGALESIREKFK